MIPWYLYKWSRGGCRIYVFYIIKTTPRSQGFRRFCKSFAIFFPSDRRINGFEIWIFATRKLPFWSRKKSGGLVRCVLRNSVWGLFSGSSWLVIEGVCLKCSSNTLRTSFDWTLLLEFFVKSKSSDVISFKYFLDFCFHCSKIGNVVGVGTWRKSPWILNSFSNLLVLYRLRSLQGSGFAII